MFITNTQTSIGNVKIMTKIDIYKNFGKQLYIPELYIVIKLMDCIHSFSNVQPWAFFRILETIFTAKKDPLCPLWYIFTVHCQ